MSRWRPWPRSTSARLALAVTASFLLAFVLLGAGVHYAVSALLTQDARELVRVDAAGLVELYRDDGRAALLSELRERIASDEDPDAVYALTAHDGRMIVGDYPRLPTHRRGARWIEFAEPGGDGKLRVVAQLQRLPDGSTLLTGTRTRSQDRFLALMLRTALVALLVAASLGALVGWLTSRWVSRRLRHLDDTAERVGRGELALRATPDGSDDAFDRLARRFNAMLDRIEELLGGVRHATDHIAHDLRTPLTRLRNRLEELRARAEGDTAARLDAAIAETDQLLQSFGALLRLARIEAQPPVHDEPALDLAALAADAVELYTPIAAERGIALRIAATAQARVRGDADQLFQLLVNVLDNAVKYAPPASEVEVALRRERDEIVLEIGDRGPGIPAADRERVFDRFQRLEAHRGSPGIGLGMSLVRAIAHRHGGRIALLDQAPGLRVRVSLASAD
ncbi:HAMP domain-containing histidine kinase [Lysobacter sp. BMK333-48F3]|uniref:sensor histidine kinase n=1 Tax=Lysobacter sp. BMK333-48F3 TaxID=2867962 RepID=UPI001C8B1208|nr:HAMP domain-containing sensor histidine kinase [Lysobacter sp. BMK333-48F3]MBX9400161.1 HAMP domain-containing histidine kinase [Lysobacter sp. BMK333-48F3]